MSTRLLYISELIQKHWQGQLTAEEHVILDQWANEAPGNRELLQQVVDEEWVAGEMDKFAQYDIQKSRRQLELLLDEQSTSSTNPVHRVHFLKTAWFRYAAAILLIIGADYFFNSRQVQKDPVVVNELSTPEQKEVLPGSDKAILTLSNGQQYLLDSSSKTALAKKGIVHDDETIYYSETEEHNSLHTLSTPRGGQYHLRLNDGTMVWLNAASSITYPTKFTGDQRVVTITGEVYFEVAKDKAKPFIVKANGTEVEVLGTHFNINSYPDEQSVKTSLLEGSVKINNNILKPGEAYYKGKIVKTDLVQDIAWKNGVFNFNNADLFLVMRQLSRWYNIDVEYEGKIKSRLFQGEMDKGLNLSQVIKILGETGVKFRITGNKLTVSE